MPRTGTSCGCGLAGAGSAVAALGTLGPAPGGPSMPGGPSTPGGPLAPAACSISPLTLACKASLAAASAALRSCSASLNLASFHVLYALKLTGLPAALASAANASNEVSASGRAGAGCVLPDLALESWVGLRWPRLLGLRDALLRRTRLAGDRPDLRAGLRERDRRRARYLRYEGLRDRDRRLLCLCLDDGDLDLLRLLRLACGDRCRECEERCRAGLALRERERRAAGAVGPDAAGSATSPSSTSLGIARVGWVERGWKGGAREPVHKVTSDESSILEFY